MALDFGTSSLNFNPAYLNAANSYGSTPTTSGGFGQWASSNWFPLTMLGGSTAMNFFGPQSPNEKYFKSLLQTVQRQGNISLPGRSGQSQSYALNPQGRADYMRDIESRIKGEGYERGNKNYSPALIWTTNKALTQAGLGFDKARDMWLQQLMALQSTQKKSGAGWGALAGMAGGALLSPFTGGASIPIGMSLGSTAGSYFG